MAIRYVAIPQAGRDWWEADGSAYLPRTVHESERKPIDTGLLDVNGVELYRVSEPNPIGFVTAKVI